MNRDNLLFGIIGMLLGFIIGFLVANSLSTRDQAQRAAAGPASQGQMPGNHPPVAEQGGGDPQKVFAQVQAAMKQAREDPKNFDAQVTAAKLEYQVQRYDQSIEFLLKANQLRPDDVDVVSWLGMVNMDAGKYDAAEKWYKAALVKKPNDISILDGLCAVYLSAGKTQQAEQAIDKLAKVDPTNEDLTQFRTKLEELKKK